MKALNNIIAWLYIMVTVILGLVLILSASGGFGFKENVELFVSGQLNSPSGIWTGLILVMLGLLFLAMRLKAGTGPRSISFDNPEGEVTISVKAIEDFVRRIGQEFSQVIEITPTILPVRDGIKIKVKTVLTAGSNVPRLSENIQRMIKTRMQNILGIQNVAKIEINVSKIVTKEGEVEEPAQQQVLDIG